LGLKRSCTSDVLEFTYKNDSKEHCRIIDGIALIPLL
jgi:hypothetical protein